jgi:plasmid stabilization system protein ParE
MAYVGISRRAARDIEEIRRFSVEHWGEGVADEYLDSIEQALDRLREKPNLLRTKPEFSRHFHFYRVHRHFLVCSLVETNIYVLAVKHGSLDLPNRLAELEPNLHQEADLLHRAFLAKMAHARPGNQGRQGS